MNTEMSGDIDKIAPALVKFQSAVHGVAKTSENPFFKSKYADLHALRDATQEPLAENGLSVTQYPCVLDNGGCGLVTLLLHESGQWIRGVMPVVVQAEGPQPFGSGYTYARRYSYAGILGIAQMDDDAEAATPRISKQLETKVRNALDTAFKNDDTIGALETWMELDDDERQAIWNGIGDRVYRKQLSEFLKRAKDAADAKVDPNVIEPLPAKHSEKDQRRENVRGTR